MPEHPIEELVALLSQLPSIGARTATRLAFFVLDQERDYASALGESLRTLHERVLRCERCGNYDATPICAICRDPKRDPSVLCVVARVPDLRAIERSGTFRGQYHVLHALLAPLDGVGPDDLPLDALLARCEGEVREVVLATPLNVEGEATALYIKQVLEAGRGVHAEEEGTAAGPAIKVTRIASGVPHGGELEFTDQVTLGRAFAGRKDL